MTTGTLSQLDEEQLRLEAELESVRRKLNGYRTPILEPGITQGIAITGLLSHLSSSIILYNIIIVTVALTTFITQERDNLIKTLSLALT